MPQNQVLAAPEQMMSSAVRTVPIQQRGHAKLEAIATAARAVLADVGRDRFTTEDVARTAGVSIGTVYRYFEDRVAILDYVWPDRRDTFLDNGSS